jgi:MFS family permease
VDHIKIRCYGKEEMGMSVKARNFRSTRVPGAATALALLTALNFVNYIDRYILPGVQEGIKAEFHVSDAAIGSLTFWFFFAYMIAAPLTGWLGDVFPRKPLIVACALLISVVNVLTGTVHAFNALLLRHAVLGIGEACLGIYAPALLSDYYPKEDRNRVLTIFYIAIPVGAALGYLIGEVVGARYGWRMPFYVSAVPGLLMAALVLLILKEPDRGASERGVSHPKRDSGTSSIVHGLSLASNPPYLYATLGMAAVTFSLGGISAWMPTFLQRSGFSPSTVGLTLGAITAGTGLGGTAVGGWLAQIWLKRNPNALYLVSAWSALLTIPFGIICFFGPRAAMLPALGAAMFCIFLGTGPLNAAIVNAVPATVRATAIAVELFLIHALGDTPSPWLIGLVSDRSNLATGLGCTLVTMVIATILLFLGARTRKTSSQDPRPLAVPAD